MSDREDHPKLVGAMAAERRRYARAPATLRTVIVSRGLMLDGESIDLSESGMCLVLPVQLDAGTEVELRFALGGAASQLHKLTSLVMWSRLHDPVDESYGHGLEFVGVGDEVREALRQLVAGILASVAATGGDLPEVAAMDVHDVEGADEHARRIVQAVHGENRQRTSDRWAARKDLDAGRKARAARSFEQARTHLERAAQRDPSSAEILEELAEVLYLQGEVLRSAELFDKALRMRQEQS